MLTATLDFDELEIDLGGLGTVVVFDGQFDVEADHVEDPCIVSISLRAKDREGAKRRINLAVPHWSMACVTAEDHFARKIAVALVTQYWSVIHDALHDAAIASRERCCEFGDAAE